MIKKTVKTLNSISVETALLNFTPEMLTQNSDLYQPV